jgi:cardiolipin synthase A/B
LRSFVQPGDGIAPLVAGIDSAKNSVEILIFRFDREEIERALANAVSRGVNVHALIAYTNRGGERKLRELEMELLAAGVTVSRTANDLARYHGKLMIVDRRELYLLGFNFTYLDIEHSRSFGVITSNRALVQEAVKLFEADAARRPYVPGLPTFVVSPVNARQSLSGFIQGARSELFIYDPEISDPAMIRLLEGKLEAGVRIEIFGRIGKESLKLTAHKLPHIRLHTRTIIRDGRDAFIGSQSLRSVELDERREIGVIFRDSKVVNRLIQTFREDWRLKDMFERAGIKEAPPPAPPPAARVAKRVARAVVNGLPPVTAAVEGTVAEVVGFEAAAELDGQQVEEAVKEAVREAVKEVVEGLVEEAVVQTIPAENR